jgi:hypothetical protein
MVTNNATRFFAGGLGHTAPMRRLSNAVVKLLTAGAVAPHAGLFCVGARAGGGEACCHAAQRRDSEQSSSPVHTLALTTVLLEGQVGLGVDFGSATTEIRTGSSLGRVTKRIVYQYGLGCSCLAAPPPKSGLGAGWDE